MCMIIYTFFLFVLLTPSILVKLPKKGNKYTVAFVHGTIFAIIYHFTHMIFYKIGFKEQFKLYGDANCSDNNVIASPEILIPTGNKYNIFYSDLNNNCIGPFTFADRNIASSAALVSAPEPTLAAPAPTLAAPAPTLAAPAQTLAEPAPTLAAPAPTM